MNLQMCVLYLCYTNVVKQEWANKKWKFNVYNDIQFSNIRFIFSTLLIYKTNSPTRHVSKNVFNLFDSRINGSHFCLLKESTPKWYIVDSHSNINMAVCSVGSRYGRKNGIMQSRFRNVFAYTGSIIHIDILLTERARLIYSETCL